MKTTSTWIERDSRGNNVFVRTKRRSTVTSGRYTNLFGLRRRRFSHERIRTVSSLVRDPLALTAPLPHSKSPDHTMSQPQQTDMTLAVAPNNQIQALSFPPGMQPGPVFTYNPPYEYGHYHQAPPLTIPYAVPPVPISVPIPAATMTVDDTRYKCTICGRYRSPRYHYRHPLRAGEVPPPTVCGRCKRSGTPSTDDSDDSLRFKTSVRRYYRTDDGREEIEVFSESEDNPKLTRRPSRVRIISRSRSRSRSTERLVFRRTSRKTRRRSASTALGSIVGSFRRRPSSVSSGRTVERVYVVDEPMLAQSSTETTHIIDRGRRRLRDSSRYDRSYDDSDGYEVRATRRRVVSRAPKTTRIIRRQYSSPRIRRHVSRTGLFFDGTSPERGHRDHHSSTDHCLAPFLEHPPTRIHDYDIPRSRKARTVLTEEPPPGVYRSETLPNGDRVYRKIRDLSEDEDRRNPYHRPISPPTPDLVAHRQPRQRAITSNDSYDLSHHLERTSILDEPLPHEPRERAPRYQRSRSRSSTRDEREKLERRYIRRSNSLRYY